MSVSQTTGNENYIVYPGIQWLRRCSSVEEPATHKFNGWTNKVLPQSPIEARVDVLLGFSVVDELVGFIVGQGLHTRYLVANPLKDNCTAVLLLLYQVASLVGRRGARGSFRGTRDVHVRWGTTEVYIFELLIITRLIRRSRQVVVTGDTPLAQTMYQYPVPGTSYVPGACQYQEYIPVCYILSSHLLSSRVILLLPSQ